MNESRLSLRSDWMFEPLSPTPLDSVVGTSNLENLLEEDLLLDEALIFLSEEEKQQQQQQKSGSLKLSKDGLDNDAPFGGVFGGTMLDQEILESLADNLDTQEETGFQKAGSENFIFSGDMKRAFSPIKTIVYDSPVGGLNESKFGDYDVHGRESRSIYPSNLCVTDDDLDSSELTPSNPRKYKTKTKVKKAPYSKTASMAAKRSTTNQNPWPSAKEYVEIIKSFVADETKFERYTNADLGKCKLTGTPLQPEWLYTSPKAGMYFLECDHLRGKGSFGFPKCESLGKKAFEWKKTSYVNNVPKAKPIISYITANGNGKHGDGSQGAYRMRIIKPINLDVPNGHLADKWVLIDIHTSEGLARRNGPRPQKKCNHYPQMQMLRPPSVPKHMKYEVTNASTYKQKASVFCKVPTKPYIPAEQRVHTSSSAFANLDDSKKSLIVDTAPDTQSDTKIAEPNKISKLKTLETTSQGSPSGLVPLSPMKRLSLCTSSDNLRSFMNPSGLTGSPKGKKMQRVSQECSGVATVN